jgi:transketolase
MSQYSDANIKFVGSHAGVSIGQDGPSQMGLEDIAMFRTLLNSVVLYPCDAVSAERMVELAAAQQGIFYLRMTRGPTPVIYGGDESFSVGGSKVLRESERDRVTVVAAGVTLHEALAAHAELEAEGLLIRVIDLYSIKPLDEATLRAAAADTDALVVVEDHFAAGGLGEAVRSALCDVPTPIHSLAVGTKPRSGKPEELLDLVGISRRSIAEKVRSLR